MFENLVWIVRKNRIRKGILKYSKEQIKNSDVVPNINRKNVVEYYKKMGFCEEVDTYEHEWYLASNGIESEKYIPTYVFRKYIEPYFNNSICAEAWADKSYYDLLFNGFPFPLSIIKNVDGLYYDNNYKIVSEEDAVNIVREYSTIFIKPSMDSGSGKNVQRCDTEKSDVAKILADYGQNFVVQLPVKQHPFLSSLNESSVNVVRVISLIFNGEIVVLSATLRIGTEGSITDNCITENGYGMVCVGVDNSGKLSNTGYYANGKTINMKYSDAYLPGYEEMVEIVKSAHERMGHFKMVSWDVTIDENSHPVILEYNIKYQGIAYYQIANGPLFGDLTDRILQEVFKNANSK